MTALKNKQSLTKQSLIEQVYECFGAVLAAIALAVLVFTIVFSRITVDGVSMENTLSNDDRVLVCNINYTPKDKDIIVAYVPSMNKTIVKRVVAVGGQTVNIDYASHRVFVDGEILDEPFIKEPTAYMGIKPTKLPIKVPKGFVFVMGDNRNNSIDSRSGCIGLVSRKHIIGKAVLRYYPYTEVKRLR